VRPPHGRFVEFTLSEFVSNESTTVSAVHVLTFDNPMSLATPEIRLD
jgi:hypothetical protein